MDHKLKYSFYFAVVSTLLPLLIILPMSLLALFGASSSSLAFGSIVTIIPLASYLYLSRQAISEKTGFSTPLQITFYACFLLFMIGVLIAFNLIIIGGFLFTDQSPIGMDLVQSQAPYLVALGLYLILTCANGMYYLVKAKKVILH